MAGTLTELPLEEVILCPCRWRVNGALAGWPARRTCALSPGLRRPTGPARTLDTNARRVQACRIFRRGTGKNRHVPRTDLESRPDHGLSGRGDFVGVRRPAGQAEHRGALSP